jgi:hypothetical protein
MTPRMLLLAGGLAVCAAAAPAVRLLTHTLAQARAANQLVDEARERNARIPGPEARPGAAPIAMTAIERAVGSERSARALSEWLASRDAPPSDTSPEARAKFVEAYAARTGKPAATIAALFPGADVAEPEAIFQFITIRDLLLAAADAPMIEFNYFAFPSEGGTPAAHRFGPYVMGRAVRVEYVADYARHSDFVLGLLRRRERGPFYTLDSMTLRPAASAGVTGSLASPSTVLVTAVLRRIMGTAR